MKSFSFVLIIIVLFSTLASAKDYKKDFNHTFNVKQGVNIILENGDGNVHIKTWEKDEIAVDVIYHTSSKYDNEKARNDFEVEFNQKGDDVYIIGHEYRPRINVFSSLQYHNYIYKISAPAYANIEIKSDDGNIEIEDITGDIDCEINDGNLTMLNVKNRSSHISADDGNVNIHTHTGDLNINTEDGNVTIENVGAKEVEISTKDGRVKVRNSSADFFIDSDDGSIALLNISGNEVNARSKDGNIDIIFDGTGPIQFYVNSDDGKVDIELNEAVSARFNIESGDGHIRFDGNDSNLLRETEHYIKGEFGDGEGMIKVRTRDGSISLSTHY